MTGGFNISRYVPSEEDRKIHNPYLFEVLGLAKDIAARGCQSPDAELYAHRGGLVAKYAFSIPTMDILGVVTRRSPIVEIGAGSGYWAMCLSQLGADVIAYDRHPPENGTPWWEPSNPWFEREWFQVREGDEECARHHPDRSLLLCWPPPGDPMAAAALSMYREAGGHTLIFIGDRGSSGDREFYSLLGVLSQLVNRRLWGWWGVEDFLEIYAVR